MPNEKLSAKEWLGILSTYPELFVGEYRQSLPFKTLSDLGLKTSASAVKMGFLCVREYRSSSMRSKPGLWLHPSDICLVREAMEQVDARRQKANEHALAKLRRLVIGAFSEFTGAPQKAVDMWLTHERLGLLSIADLSKLPQDYKKGSWGHMGNVLLQMGGFDGGDFVATDHGFTSALYPFNIQFASPRSPAWTFLIHGDHSCMHTYLSEQLLKCQHEHESMSMDFLRSRPSWFPEAVLKKWLSTHTAKRRQHPLRHWEDLNSVWAAQESLSVHSRIVAGNDIDESLVSQLSQHLFADLSVKKPRKEDRCIGHPCNRLSHSLRIQVATFVALEQALWAAKLNDPPVEQSEFMAATVHIAQEALASFRDKFLLSARSHLQKAFEGLSAQMCWALSILAWDFGIRNAHVSSRFGLTASKLKAQLDRSLAIIEGKYDRWQASRRCMEDTGTQLKDLYPLARSMNRRITFICGPTNSGKTHLALQYLRAARSGVYLAPLRLLALEIQERLQEEGLPTSLLTGESRLDVVGAAHSARTIEMLDDHQPVEVAVIDEVQMLGDRDRGSAWLHAILATPAEHLILIGSLAAIDVVKELIRYTGEPLDFVQLERKGELQVCDAPHNLKTLAPGTAVVAFSRRDVLSIAGLLREHGHSVSLIYGALTPEVRREQARQFRTAENNVLVATDAIGMGLNLPINELVFATLEKFNGLEMRKLTPEEARQIAGRVGRYGVSESARVSALQRSDLKWLKKTLDEPVKPLPMRLKFGLTSAMAHTISAHTGSTDIAEILDFFTQHIKMDEWAKPMVSNESRHIARLLDNTTLDLSQKLRLLGAPAGKGEALMPEFEQMVRFIERGIVSRFDFLTQDPHTTLQDLEDRCRKLSLYAWMALRFETVFPCLEQAQKLQAKLNERINILLRMTQPPMCETCAARLPWNFSHRNCDNCYRSFRGGYAWEDGLYD